MGGDTGEIGGDLWRLFSVEVTVESAEQARRHEPRAPAPAPAVEVELLAGLDTPPQAAHLVNVRVRARVRVRAGASVRICMSQHTCMLVHG